MVEAHGAHDSLCPPCERETRGDARAVRAGEQLDWPRARRRGCARTAGERRRRASTCRASLEVAQFPGGHSNLTYLVRFGDAELVLRRPPFGPVPPTAHDMAREFRWLSALHPRLSARAAAVPALRGPRRHRLGVLRDGAAARPRRARRGAAAARRHPDGAAPRQRSADRHARRSARDRRARAAGSARSASRPASSSARCAAGPSAGTARRRRRCRRWMRSPTGCASICPPNPAAPSVVHGDFKLDNVMLDPLTTSAASSRSSTGR